MTPEEVAKELGISRSTLQRLIKDELLHPIDPVEPFKLRQKPYSFRRSDVVALKNTPRQRKPRTNHK